MASAKLYDFNGELKGNIDLPADLFDGEVNKGVLYDAIRAYMANSRNGNAHTKTRGEVNFTKKKPYKQKGTGRARAGKRSSGIWRGGGTIFGPRNRDYSVSIPRKFKRAALKSALADKGRDEGVVVVENFRMEKPETKVFASFLRLAGIDRKKVLLAVDAYDENIYKSVRNVPGVKFMVGKDLNAYEILNAEILLLTRETVSSLEEVFA
jgi:large subunit ribosomal protein L4